jgi:uncharacterized protein (DUF1810 family)
MSDPFDLERFTEAQRGSYDQALTELRAGQKRTHWMWFIFPQLAGLGSSAMAQRFAIGDLAEAQAYLAHPVLGPRLRACTEVVNQVRGRDVHQIFGAPDDLKFHSSMTLFAAAAPADPGFDLALRTYFEGRGDPRTLDLLGAGR